MTPAAEYGFGPLDPPEGPPTVDFEPCPHGVAVVARPAVEVDGDPYLLLMCECGWHEVLGQVTTADYIAELVAQHQAAAPTVRLAVIDTPAVRLSVLVPAEHEQAAREAARQNGIDL